MGKKTALYDCHVAAHAKIVDFAGWDMPLHYGSQIQEHHIVRKDSGVFDVSHMTIVDMMGNDVLCYLRRLLANDVERLFSEKALYSCMLNEQGGVIDDLIVYKVADDFFRVVVNAATHDKDVAWFSQQKKEDDVTFRERTDLSMLAIQGPRVREKIAAIFDSPHAQSILDLKSFTAVRWDEWFIARTGYTGEDGFEVILPGEDAPIFWKKLLDQNITPCGLGARDTLRLEAGLNLYGADMDEKVTPLESNLAWTIAWDPKNRDFIGREALEKQLKEGVKQKLIGLILEEQGVLRNHQKVIVEGVGVGEITSGSFSPTLNKGIALARVPEKTASPCFVEIRGKKVAVKTIQPPFVKKVI